MSLNTLQPMKRNNIHILTNDDSFYIVHRNSLEQSRFFTNIFKNHKTKGNFYDPIFIQNISGSYFSAALSYMNCMSNNYTKTKDILQDVTIKLHPLDFNKFLNVLDTLQIDKNTEFLNSVQQNLKKITGNNIQS